MLPGLLLIQGEVSSTHALDRQISVPAGAQGTRIRPPLTRQPLSKGLGDEVLTADGCRISIRHLKLREAVARRLALLHGYAFAAAEPFSRIGMSLREA
ncbi:hypothetical protein BKG77_22745 [Mycobacteroides chelonae]|nr:hypothetical protein BKG77_22745 [Mycobacteroides chelonae]OHU61878.1 hypothetical protein BKG85_23345 [Mycobacteroides chelonae]